MAQVHKAELKDGTRVAVKVQHPNIEFQCPGDILTVKIGIWFATIMFPDFKYGWLSKEFETNLPAEIDFRNEGQNADRARDNLKDYTKVVVPKVFWKYTAKKVLTMSFEEGRPITDINYIRKNKMNLFEISEILSEVFNRQIFHHGFVHGDPHPGNLFIRLSKNNQLELVLLDHGLYKILDESFRFNYANLWRGIITQNKNVIRESCVGLSVTQVELFMSIVTNNTYDDIMSKEDKYGNRFSQKSKFNL